MTPKASRFYTRAIFVVSLALVLLTGGVNYLVDPHLMNGFLQAEHINRIKSESEIHERLYKAAVLARLGPSVLALGTSRTEMAISMDHPGWQGVPLERYNAALVGSNIYEISRYFEHANRIHALKQVVIGLDFMAFNYYKLNRPDFDEKLLLRDQREISASFWLEQAKIYFSIDTLGSSLRTLLCNFKSCEAPYLSDGRVNPEYFERDWAERHGHHNAFLTSARRSFTDLIFPPPYRSFALVGPGGTTPMQHLRRIIEISRRDDIDLRLFISPAHARQWEVLRAAGLWPEFERWKKLLVQVVAEDAAAHAACRPIPIWDFADYNSISTERVPPQGDEQTRMSWYWESSHFKKEVGDMVLNRVLDGPHLRGHVPDDFGVLLDPNTINAHLAEVRSRAERYRATHPEDIAEIDALARETESKRKTDLTSAAPP